MASQLSEWRVVSVIYERKAMAGKVGPPAPSSGCWMFSRAAASQFPAGSNGNWREWTPLDELHIAPYGLHDDRMTRSAGIRIPVSSGGHYGRTLRRIDVHPKDVW